MGAVALFLTGGFGMFPVESGELSHDSRYIVLNMPLRLLLLCMPLMAGMLLVGTGIILRKQILAAGEAARNLPEIRGRF